MAKADLHIHTIYSDGMGTVPAVLESAKRAGLSVVAITDHNKVRGALEARDLAPRYGVAVVPGSEITTADGHLLALYVDRRIPAGQPLLDTVLRVGDLGGICIAPHPEALLVPSLSERRIRRVLVNPLARHILVGMEAYNGGLLYLRNNDHADVIARMTGLARVASSDSHLLWTIGTCATEFPGTTVEELRSAIINRQTRPYIGKRSGSYYLSFAKNFLLREAGLAYWTPEPGEPIVLRRLATVSTSTPS
jgi:predicted metal-dependent phosphoesterase TrpH